MILVCMIGFSPLCATLSIQLPRRARQVEIQTEPSKDQEDDARAARAE